MVLNNDNMINPSFWPETSKENDDGENQEKEEE